MKNIDKLILQHLQELKNEKLGIIEECTIAAVRLDDGIVLAKNRDRGYVAKMQVVHEIVDDVEMVYWRDVDTDWSEGMNEYGFGIVNSSLLVRQDEKEGDKVNKKQSKGDDKKLPHDATEKMINASDGTKLRKALTYTKMRDIIKSIISYDGGDKKKVGVKGETFVASPRNIFVIEMTSKDSPIIHKFDKSEKVDVRTNHGIGHQQAGYTHGIKKKSSHMRMKYAKEHLKDVTTDQEVIDRMKEQYDKNKFFNPYRMKNQYNMSTVGQIMMNLEKKEVTVRMDNEMGRFEGIDNRLPKGYTPKIKIKIENEKTHDENGKKLPS
jgi:ribosomal protein S25